MCNRRQMGSRSESWWGILILGIGLVFLIGQVTTFDVPGFGDLWPLLIIAFGVTRFRPPTDPQDIEGGVMWTLVGLWFLAHELNWWDYGWRETWPLLLVIWGLAAIVRALLERNARSNVGGAA